MTVVENKIPTISNLVKKKKKKKISEIEKKVTDHNHDKYITFSKFDKLTTKKFNARLAQANLETNTDFDAKLIRLNKKINSNKTKHLLAKNELKKLQAFDLSYFRCKKLF